MNRRTQPKSCDGQPRYSRVKKLASESLAHKGVHSAVILVLLPLLCPIGVIGCGGSDEPTPCQVQMIRVDDFYIFAHEASRPDATPQGEGESSRSVCSRPGVLPMGNVTWHEARQLCNESGYKLCTWAQWQRACGGPDVKPYPYGFQEISGACNDYNSGTGQALPTGEKESCLSDDGAFDMVGNLGEWVILEESDNDGLPSEREAYAGGTFLLSQMAFSLRANRCSTVITPVSNMNFKSKDVGFRCCTEEQL